MPRPAYKDLATRTGDARIRVRVWVWVWVRVRVWVSLTTRPLDATCTHVPDALCVAHTYTGSSTGSSLSKSKPHSSSPATAVTRGGRGYECSSQGRLFLTWNPLMRGAQGLGRPSQMGLARRGTEIDQEPTEFPPGPDPDPDTHPIASLDPKLRPVFTGIASQLTT